MKTRLKSLHLRLTKQELNRSRFSIAQLLVFIITFGVIGAIILLVSHAAPIPNASITAQGPDAKARALQDSQTLIAGAPVLKHAAAVGDATKHAKVKGDLATVSDQRTKDMLTLMKTDPNSARQAILPQDAIDKLNSEGVATEQKATLTGRFLPVQVDTPDGKDLVYKELVTADNKVHYLDTEQVYPNITSSSTIQASGYVLNDQLLVDQAAGSDLRTSNLTQLAFSSGSNTATTNLTAPITTVSAAASQTSLGAIREAVIMAIFSGQSAPSWTASSVKAIYNGTSGADVASWVAANSHGKATLAPDFFGPYNINGSCNYQAALNAANADITYSNYSRIAVIYNCGGGSATGSGPVSTPQGTFTFNQIVNGDAGIYGNTHELAHTLGNFLYHGGYLDCGSQVFVPPVNSQFDDGTCVSAEYQDPYDVLGNGNNGIDAGMLSTPHMLAAGWLDSSQVTTVSAPGTSNTYTLQPYETGNGVVALDIPRGSSGSYFTVEYRQPVGFDSYLHCSSSQNCIGQTNGASLRLGGVSYSGSGGGTDNNIIDMTPNSYPNKAAFFYPVFDGVDGEITAGNSFTDSEYGIVIKTISADSSGVTVQVTIPETASCTYATPTVSAVSPSSQTASTGQSINYNFTVTNNDSASCQPEYFAVAKNYTSTSYNQVRLTTNPDYFSLPAGASKTVTATVSSTNLALDGSYNWQLVVTPKSYGTPSAYSQTFSNQVSSPADTTPPSTPTSFTVTPLGAATVKLTWGASTDNTGVAGYAIAALIGGSQQTGATTFPNQTSLILSQLYPSTNYSFTIRAFDHKDNFSSPASASADTPAVTDSTPPTRLTNITTSNVADHGYTVSWGKAYDNAGVAFYRVVPCLVGNSQSGDNCTVPGNQNSFTASGLPSGGNLANRYGINVYPYDYDGNSNFSSLGVSVNTAVEGDTQAPTTPQMLYISSLTSNGMTVNWQPSSDENGIDHYIIYRGCCKYNTAITTNSFADPATNVAGYSVQAVDKDGSVSGRSNVFGTPSGSGPPSSGSPAPPSVSINSVNSGDTLSGTITLNSTASSSSAIRTVDYYLDSFYLGSTSSSPYSLNVDTTKFNDGSHWLLAIAQDSPPNGGGDHGASAPVPVTFNNTGGDITPPTVSITNPTDGSTVTGSVNVMANAADNKGVSSVAFAVDGNTASTVSSAPYSFNWNSSSVPNGNHTITATAYDAAGNSAVSNISVTTANTDTTPPSTPSNLSAIAASQTQINLSWTASTDNVGVAGYYIIRNGVTIAQTNASVCSGSNACSYSDTNLNSGTNYSYQVEAFDAAANTSPASNMATATTQSPAPDTTPPTVPTNLVAAVASANQINLSWTASSDNVAVDHYDIYRSNTKIASINALAATDSSTSTVSFGDTTTLPKTSYSYWVIAYDSSGNKSSTSAKASITTPSVSTTLGSLTGRLTNASGAPLSNAKVAFSLNGRTTSASSNSNGNYVLSSVTAGNTAFTYSLSGYLSQNLTIFITAGANSLQDMTLHKLGSITGTVTSSSTSTALSNVVVAYSLNGTAKTTKTNMKGQYTITALPAGSYSLTYSLTNYTPQTQSVNVNQDSTTTQNVSLSHL